MKYKSTRGGMTGRSFSEAVKMGLASDGGLFVPEDEVKFDQNTIKAMAGMTYQQIAETVISKYADDFTQEEIRDCVERAYQRSAFPDGPAAVEHINDDISVLELWHGPTSAFKDMALQILPKFMVYAQKKCGSGEEIVILTATSGDTGKAALEGFKDIDGIKVMVFYPVSGVSEMQKYQMITQEGGNVNVTAINGNFDNAQSGVKTIFSDKAFAKELAAKGKILSSANSINWGRLLPQIVYYFFAYAQMVKSGRVEFGEKVNFAVPTGNFGDILACYYAKKAGLPVGKIICASNDNRVVADFLNTGKYDKKRKFITTTSPAMDILISSNLERLVFDACGGDTEKVAGWMEQLKNDGEYTVDDETFKEIRKHFAAGCADQAEVSDTIRGIYNKYGYLADPHTSVGIKVCMDYIKQSGDKTKTVCVSTASPFKFNTAVADAIYGSCTVEGLSEFKILDFLSEKTGKEIPAPLKGLDTRTVRFKKVCEVPDMKKNVEDFVYGI